MQRRIFEGLPIVERHPKPAPHLKHGPLFPFDIQGLFAYLRKITVSVSLLSVDGERQTCREAGTESHGSYARQPGRR